MRAALYARFSSENQRDASIEDQLRVCRARAEREGWTVVAVHTDHATSGATTLRAGYQGLLTAVRAGEVDVVVAESLDRFSRDMEHIAAFFKQSTFHNVRLFTLAEGDISELHVGLKGVMGAIYLKDLADKTRRGLQGRVHAGRCVGMPPYGYTVVRKISDDGDFERGLRAIDPERAAVVKRIFKDYAGGHSPRSIARALNAEGVPGPGGGIWFDSSIRGRAKRQDGILRNALYNGRFVWSRRRNVKDPVTGSRLRRDASPDTFVESVMPELQIIDDDLWQRVQSRLEAEAAPQVSEALNASHAFWRQRRPRHVLSGKVICGVCGGPFSSLGKDYLGCLGGRNRACSNQRTVRRAMLEAHMLDVMGRQLMQPEMLGEFIAAFNDDWQRLAEAAQGEAALRQRERMAIERKIANLVDAIADGRASPAILTKLKQLEASAAAVPEVGSSSPVPQKLPSIGLAERYAERIGTLTAQISGGDDQEGVELLRRLIDTVVIYPDPSDNQPDGIEFIGNLLELLRMAGLGEPQNQGEAAKPDPVLELFVSSVKADPGAEPRPPEARTHP